MTPIWVAIAACASLSVLINALWLITVSFAHTRLVVRAIDDLREDVESLRGSQRRVSGKVNRAIREKTDADIEAEGLQLMERGQ